VKYCWNSPQLQEAPEIDPSFLCFLYVAVALFCIGWIARTSPALHIGGVSEIRVRRKRPSFMAAG
jgi:hypothetical protein